MQLKSKTVAIRDVEALARFVTEARELNRALNAALAEDGLRDDLWRIMHALSSAHGMLMGELAESLALPAATATRLVDELTDSGVTFRRPASDDGRKVAVYLSRQGQERLKRVEAILQARLLDA